MMTETPQLKRVRFSHSFNSNEVTHITILNNDTIDTNVSLNTLLLNNPSFTPKFTYPAFGTNETINGYSNLKIHIIFNGYTFSSYRSIQYDDKDQHLGPTLDEMDEMICKMLSKDTTKDEEIFKTNYYQSIQEFQPPGIVVHQYIRNIDEKNRYFEIVSCPLSENSKAQMLFNNLQMLAMFYIEGADTIDVKDNRWVIYIIYERENVLENQEGYIGWYKPVGYISLFKFYNPIGRFNHVTNVKAHETHRICQALIFPTYQRQGHGQELLEYLTSIAMKNTNVYEITVEDPVPDFSMLRDVVDVKNCVSLEYFSQPPDINAPANTLELKAKLTNSLHADTIQYIQEVMKLTKLQVHRCYEVLKFQFIDCNQEDIYKKYRLEVKKRLNKHYAEDLDGLETIDARKAFLDKEYRKLEAHYILILKKLKIKIYQN